MGKRERAQKQGRLLFWESLAELTQTGSGQRTFMLNSWPLAVGLTLPLLHLASLRLGWLEGAKATQLDWVVLIWILAFGLLALVRHHLVEKKAQEIWLRRLEFEEVIKSSHHDLRVIVERIQATQARMLAEEKFRWAFLKTPHAIAIQRASDGSYLEINSAFEHLFGLHRDEVVGRRVEDIGLWPDPSEEERLRKSAIRRALEERRVVLRHASGEERIVLVSAGQSRFENDFVILSIARDITEQVRADERQRPRANLLFQSSKVVFAVDGAGLIRYWNEQAREVLEWRAMELIGRRAEEKLSPLGSPAPSAVWAEIDRRGFWRGEAAWRKRSEREVPLRGWGFRVEDSRTGDTYRLMVLDRPDQNSGLDQFRP